MLLFPSLHIRFVVSKFAGSSQNQSCFANSNVFVVCCHWEKLPNSGGTWLYVIKRKFHFHECDVAIASAHNQLCEFLAYIIRFIYQIKITYKPNFKKLCQFTPYRPIFFYILHKILGMDNIYRNYKLCLLPHVFFPPGPLSTLRHQTDFCKSSYFSISVGPLGSAGDTYVLLIQLSPDYSSTHKQTHRDKSK